MSYQINLPQLGQVLTSEPGANLYQLLAAAGLLDAPCGGNGTCGKCGVLIDGVEHLACTYRVESDIMVLLPQQTQLQSITADGYIKPFTADPWPQGSYGVAVDIGTTTVIATLYDLAQAQEVASLSCLNSQKAFGQDVISRITHAANQQKGTEELQALIIADLTQLLNGLLAQNQLEAAAIKQITIAGNTTMIHLLAGIDPSSLGVAPYLPAFSGALHLEASQLGLPVECPVYCLPAVAAFVGGDIIAGLLACDIDAAKGKTLFIDIGTNGEIVLANEGKMFCCSCAAGPALEGMNISCGMRAAPGAIEEVRIAQGQVSVATIGGAPACGLCGSGLLSAIAELRRVGVIDASGRLTGDPLVSKIAGKKGVLLTDNIYLGQSDIRHVQLSKGAILSGVLTLLDAAGVAVEQLDRVLIAGQFGLHLAAESIIGSGLLPAACQDKISYVGNTSKSGAALCLLSAAEREHSESLAEDIAYLELSALDGYDERFIDCLSFGH